jgi:hypothetical protein
MKLATLGWGMPCVIKVESRAGWNGGVAKKSVED